VAHANARTTVYARKLIVDRVLAGHRPGEVAKQLGVSRQTVYTWVRRLRAEGEAGLADRSSRPHRMPRRTSAETTAAIVAARREHHAGPMRLAAILGLAASTIGAALARAGMPQLADVDRLTGELLRGRRHSDRLYEHEHPGDLLHVDVKKLGRVPDGGGWRIHGRREEVRGRGNGWDYVHVAIDDHTRLAYAEVLPDEKTTTCAAFLRRATARFAARGVVVRRVLAERFNRTLQTEWAYATAWMTNDERTAALDSWLEHYNTALSHFALARSPADQPTRHVNNLSGHDIWGAPDRTTRLDTPGRAE
jgi:transposase